MSPGRARRTRVLWQIARADFLERVRRYSFLVTLLLAVYFGYLAATGKVMLQVGHMRGVYNSAWIGALMSLVATTFLSLAGFYVVKNTIERDRATRVGEILASTPISKLLYMTGKWVSNFLVLGVMVLILALSGIVMLFLQGEDTHLDLWRLLSPFLLLALPAMAVVAAVAVLFETFAWLRGGFGNVVYFFVWVGGLAGPTASGAKDAISPFDWPGLGMVWTSMRAASHAANNSFSFSLEIGSPDQAHSVFLWNGIAWTFEMVFLRLAWIGFAFLLVSFSALIFDRFDPARRGLLENNRKMARIAVSDEASSPALQPAVTLTALVKAPASVRFGAMVVAELRLMLKGQKWWWYAGALLLFVLSAALPSSPAGGLALAVAWIWPVLLWSVMGVREKRDQTSQLLFSAPHPIARQLTAVWFAGVALAAMTGGGFALRLLVGGEFREILVWGIGAIFIPTLALALGVWSGSTKPFEILYTLLWYVGPMHATVPLDFMGSVRETAFTRVPLFYLALAAAMGLLAIAGRRQQLQS